MNEQSLDRPMLRAASPRPTALICGGISGRLEAALSSLCELRHWEGDSEVPFDAVNGADLLILRSPYFISRRTAEQVDGLKMAIRAGSGMEGLCAELLSRRGVAVHRVNGAAASVAEHGFALLLSAARAVPAMQAAAKAGRWLKAEAQGIELSGKTLLIVGFGEVGRRVARIADGFGLDIVIADPSMWKEEKRAALAGLPLVRCLPLEQGFGEADLIFLCCSLTERTSGLIDEAAIGRIKPGAILVNIARAGLIVRDALVEGLRSGRLATVGLDVHYDEPALDRELLSDERIVATPHIGAQTTEARERIERQVLALVASFAASEACNG